MKDKYSIVPEGFTRNEAGDVLKGTNERRKTVAGVLYQETKNIKRPKKNANVRQHKKEIAEGKNHFDMKMTIKKDETLEWERNNIDRVNKGLEPLTFQQYFFKKTKASKQSSKRRK